MLQKAVKPNATHEGHKPPAAANGGRANGSAAGLWTRALPALPLQAKLTVNQPGDIYEQEADRVAAQVMRMPDPAAGVVRRCACGGVADESGECPACRAKRLGLQRQSDAAGGMTAPPSVHATLRAPGQPLDGGARAFMESRFGQDFGGVRVHTDSGAAASARAVGAQAYTVGQNVVFGEGRYAPGTTAGNTLIAHELAHVVQQGSSCSRSLKSEPRVARQSRNQVEVVRVSCPNNSIEFITSSGSWTYDLGTCDVDTGDYMANVSVVGSNVDFELLNAGESTRFNFSYAIRSGQENPATLFRGGQRTVRVVAEAGSASGGVGVEFQVRRLTPEEFQRLTGMSPDALPENVITSIPLAASGSSFAAPPATSVRTASPTPTSQIPEQERYQYLIGGAMLGAPSLIPNNSIGFMWEGSHLSLFSNTGETTIRGFRGHLGNYIGEYLPGDMGRSYTQRLIRGVPGRYYNDFLFGLIPGRTVVYQPTTPEGALEYRDHLLRLQTERTYRYSPPRPGGPGSVVPDPTLPVGQREGQMFERIFASGESSVIICGTNNCITVPAAEIERILGERPRVSTPSGQLDIISGQTESGARDPFRTGRARDMTRFLDETPDSFFAERGLVRVTPGALRAMVVFKGAGGIMMLFGILHTAQRLNTAAGTPEMPRVVAEEAGSWTGGLLGGALGTALGAAVVCAPTGPVTAICVAAGFVGGLIFGYLGSQIGTALGGALATTGGGAPCPSCHAMQRDWERQRSFSGLERFPAPRTSEEDQRLIREYLQPPQHTP